LEKLNVTPCAALVKKDTKAQLENYTFFWKILPEKCCFCAAGILSFDNFWNAVIDAAFYFLLNHLHSKNKV
jgi:hypothetical protein